MRLTTLTKRLAPGMIAAAAVLPCAITAQEYDFAYIIHGSPGVPFFQKLVAGAEEAARQLGSTVEIAFGDGDPVNQNNILEGAIAKGVDGIAIVINVDDAYEENIRRAIEAGIPVIASNVDDSRGAEGSARLAFVGQDFEVAGYAIGRVVVEAAKIADGDVLACPVEYPEANYAVERHAGVERALNEVGATCDMFGVGATSMDEVLTRISQYLLGRRDTRAVIGLGSMPTEMAPQAIADVGLDIIGAGFDVSEPIIRDIIEGRLLATVDQQPFYQGYMAILQLYYLQKYGLQPGDFNTGSAIIDASNAEIVLELAASVR